jgi:hypothetical protein
MTLPMPKKVPAPGYYHHYKHDPNVDAENYAYEVVSVGFHTEADARPGEEHFVNYRPLYESSVYVAAQALGVPCVDTRPLEMWMGEVEKKGHMVPRFAKVTDRDAIAKLDLAKARLYPQG